MIVIRDRSVCNPNVEISIPSIVILPPADSIILNKLRVSDDFPAPVRPTIPTWKFKNKSNRWYTHLKQAFRYRSCRLLCTRRVTLYSHDISGLCRETRKCEALEHRGCVFRLGGESTNRLIWKLFVVNCFMCILWWMKLEVVFNEKNEPGKLLNQIYHRDWNRWWVSIHFIENFILFRMSYDGIW